MLHALEKKNWTAALKLMEKGASVDHIGESENLAEFVDSVKKSKGLTELAQKTEFDQQILGSKRIMLDLIEKDPDSLCYAAEELKQDRDFMLAAIEKDSRCMFYAAEELKQDRDFMLAAIEKGSRCMLYAAKELKQDRDFMLAAIEKVSRCMFYGAEELKQDRDFMQKGKRFTSLEKLSKIKTKKFPRDYSPLTKDFKQLKAELSFEKMKATTVEELFQNEDEYITFIYNCIVFLDGVDTVNADYTKEWVEKIVEISRKLDFLKDLSPEAQEIFERFCENISGLTTDDMEMNASEEVKKLCGGQKLLFKPRVKGHFIYIEVEPKADDKGELESVQFTVGNTGGGAIATYNSDKKRFEGKQQTCFVIKRDEESLEEFKDILEEKLSQLRGPGTGADKVSAKEFTTTILPTVFPRITPTSPETKDKKMQTVGNCALKALLKTYLHQTCEEGGCPTAYHEITSMLCMVQCLFFKDDPVVLERLLMKTDKLQVKLQEDGPHKSQTVGATLKENPETKFESLEQMLPELYKQGSDMSENLRQVVRATKVLAKTQLWASKTPEEKAQGILTSWFLSSPPSLTDNIQYILMATGENEEDLKTMFDELVKQNPEAAKEIFKQVATAGWIKPEILTEAVNKGWLSQEEVKEIQSGGLSKPGQEESLPPTSVPPVGA